MQFRAEGMNSPTVDQVIERLEREDVLGQFGRGDGRIAELASDGGRPLLDWMGALDRLLATPGGVAGAVRVAEQLVSGSRHLVWAGMGGSVQAVRCLAAPGVIPLDSTDPARLRRLWDETGGLASTAMVGVSMGMTSEEPLTHLRWFGDRGAAVMTLPGSVLAA